MKEGGFRSKVKDIMKQFRSGTLKDPSGLGTQPFANKYAAKKYAFESASAGLTDKPKFYADRYAKITKQAANQTAKPKPEPTDKPPGYLGGPKVEPVTKPKESPLAPPSSGKKAIKLAKKARRMNNRGMKDVYDIQNVDPYKPPTKK